MLVIPTWVAENSYIPPPWVVSYSILILFVLEDWQVDLHPKTPSCLYWLVTFSGHSHHVQLLGISIASPIRTPFPRRGWTTRSVSRKLCFSLSSTLSTTLTSMLRMSISSFECMITCITISCLHFASIFFQAPHTLSNVVCCGGGPGCIHHSLGTSWPPCLSSLSTTASVTAQQHFCMIFTVAPTWAVLHAQLTAPVKLNPTSLVFPKGSPSLSDHHPKN